MNKKIFALTSVIIVLLLCIVSFIGCGAPVHNVKTLFLADFKYDAGLNLTFDKRLPKVQEGFEAHTIRYLDGGFEGFYNNVKVPDGYTKTLYLADTLPEENSYALIQTEIDGIKYTWGIFKAKVWHEFWLEPYQFVISNLTCTINNQSFFFPIYALEYPCILWSRNSIQTCEMDIQELATFYVEHGMSADIEGNVLTVSALVGSSGSKNEVTWCVTYHSEHELSVMVKKEI